MHEIVRRLDARVHGIVREHLHGQVFWRVIRITQQEVTWPSSVALFHSFDGSMGVAREVNLWNYLDENINTQVSNECQY